MPLAIRLKFYAGRNIIENGWLIRYTVSVHLAPKTGDLKPPRERKMTIYR